VQAFRTIGAVLMATESALLAVIPDRALAAAHLTAIREGLMQALRAQVLAEPVLSTSRAVTEYLFAAIAHAPVEQIRVLYLDAGNRLIGDELIAQGSVRQAVVPAHAILRRAVTLGASAIILAHNHPSGDLNPSEADILATNRMARMARNLDIRLHDHLIVARTGVASLRALGLLEGMPGGE
jgi:DNA repair protein RadC